MLELRALEATEHFVVISEVDRQLVADVFSSQERGANCRWTSESEQTERADVGAENREETCVNIDKRLLEKK